MVTRNAEGSFGYCPGCASGRLQKHGRDEHTNRQRYRCRDCGRRIRKPLRRPEDIEGSGQQFISSLPAARRYVFAAAQNATPAFLPGLASLRHYCEHRGAMLIVSGYRYRNPTSQWTAAQDDHEWWADELVPHLYQTRASVTPLLDFLGDVFPQATAVKPITGFEGMSGDRSCIIPHPKRQMRTVPTPAHRYPKIISTTGAITIPNYTPTKAGAIGEFHHVLGALVVEIEEDGRFAMRDIAFSKKGVFYDLCDEGVLRVHPKDGVSKGERLAGLVMGDTHVDFIDEQVRAATFDGPTSIVGAGDPKVLVWHDLIDLYSRSRYADDPFIEVAKGADGRDSVREELERGWAFHDMHVGGRRSIVVPSNHTNSRLQWYMRTTDWRRDTVNAEFYLETALQMVRSLRETPAGYAYDDPFVFWGKRLSKAPNVKFLDRDEPCMIAGIDCQYHGDLGPGAAKSASLMNMRRLGAKVVFGHTHEPGTEEGAMSVGTSTLLRLGYNQGPSGWMNSHIGILPDGKRQHHFIMDGCWTY